MMERAKHRGWELIERVEGWTVIKSPDAGDVGSVSGSLVDQEIVQPIENIQPEKKDSFNSERSYADQQELDLRKRERRGVNLSSAAVASAVLESNYSDNTENAAWNWEEQRTILEPVGIEHRGYLIRGDDEGGWGIRRDGQWIDRAASLTEAKALIDFRETY